MKMNDFFVQITNNRLVSFLLTPLVYLWRWTIVIACFFIRWWSLWILLFVVGGLIAGTVLFFVLNESTLTFGHDLGNYQHFFWIMIAMVTTLFVFLCIFYHFIGFYVGLLIASFISIISFIFSNWILIPFDYLTLILIIIFAIFGLLWMLYFFLLLQRHSRPKTPLWKIWYSIWPQYLPVLYFYLFLFALGWIFFLFGDLGSTLLGWLGVLVNRNYFAPLGRSMLILVFLSFLLHFVVFIVITLFLLFALDRWWKINLFPLGKPYFFLRVSRFCFYHLLNTAQLIGRFLSRYFTWIASLSSLFFRSNLVFSHRLSAYFRSFGHHYFVTPIKTFTFPYLSNSARWSFWLRNLFIFFVILAIIFLCFALDFNVPLFSNGNVWKKTSIQVKPLLNQYDQESVIDYFTWERERLTLFQDMQSFEASNFRIVPVIQEDGDWIYGVDFFQPLSIQAKQFLQSKGFKEVSIYRQYWLMLWFDLRWFLIVWSVILPLFAVLLFVVFGLEYALVFSLGNALRLLIIFVFALFFSQTVNGNLLKLLLFWMPIDFLFSLSFCFYHRYYSQTTFPFLFTKHWKFFLGSLVGFLMLFALIFPLLGYGWVIFVPLSLFLSIAYLSAFVFSWNVLLQLHSYKTIFCHWLRNKLFSVYNLNQTETVIPQLND